MKNLKRLFFAALVLIMASCSSEGNEQAAETLVPVTVQVEGFAISQEDVPPVTRADEKAAADYDAVKTMTLAFYNSDGSEAYKKTQVRGSLAEGETFGEFSGALSPGTYTMVVLANCGESAFNLTSSTSATCTDERLKDNFVATKSVVVNTNAVTVTATLKRVVSMLGIKSTDTRTSAATKVRMSFSKGGRDFNPMTGLALTDTGFDNTPVIKNEVGKIMSISSYLFLGDDEQTMDVTIQTLDDDDNVLLTKVVNNVPFKRNRMTVLTGKMFSADASASSFTIDISWLDSYNMNF